MREARLRNTYPVFVCGEIATREVMTREKAKKEPNSPVCFGKE
jgi:hypothetical protein